MSAPLLSVEGMGVDFAVGDWPRRRTLRALHDVSLTLDRGEVVALVGESGSGKSTLARLLARHSPPSRGRWLLDGRDVLSEEPKGPSLGYRRRVQLVFQDPYASLNPAHPVGHGVERALMLHGHATRADARERVVEALARVGLPADTADRLPGALSGGQRQRAALARALAVVPDLLLADEPTSMLDVSLRADVLGLLAREASEHRRGVLLVTHDLASAWRVATRAVVLYAGQVMEEGPARDVLSAPRHPYARLLVSAARRDTDLRSPLPAAPGRPIVIDPPPGCPFAARCPLATDTCRAGDAPVRTIAPRHHVRCHLEGATP